MINPNDLGLGLNGIIMLLGQAFDKDVDII